MACKTTLFFEKVCVKAEIFIPLHQQNPPRFSLDQRTRAGLLLYMSTIRLYSMMEHTSDTIPSIYFGSFASSVSSSSC